MAGMLRRQQVWEQVAAEDGMKPARLGRLLWIFIVAESKRRPQINFALSATPLHPEQLEVQIF